MLSHKNIKTRDLPYCYRCHQKHRRYVVKKRGEEGSEEAQAIDKRPRPASCHLKWSTI